MAVILIADSGSTKTDWVVVGNGGSIVAEFTSQGINPFFQDLNEVSSVLEKEVYHHLSEEPDAIFFYGAGCANAVASTPVTDSLKKRFPEALIEVESDLLGAARSVCQHSQGIACILGTGSNNALYDGNKIVGNVGSLGFWMGDEGSGGYLGKQLVTSYLHGDLPDELALVFSEKYPEVNRMEILDRAYKKPFPNRYFARYTYFIHEHRNHPFVTGILRNSFDLFLQKYVMKHPGARQHPVSFVGSVAWHFYEELVQAVEVKELRLGEIAKRPMPGLVRFHTSA